MNKIDNLVKVISEILKHLQERPGYEKKLEILDLTIIVTGKKALK